MKKELLNCTLKVTEEKDTNYINELIKNFICSEAIFTFEDIVTKNQNVKKIVQYAKKAAKTDCSILVQGSSGTGKEVFAEAIHNYSGRAKEPFIVVNCATMPREILEKRLFGYSKETFTDKNEKKYPGKLEFANGGTILLDNIEELSLDMQKKLLKILDDNKLTIGQCHDKNMNVRIIAATSKNLIEEVSSKGFRSDLYYKLNVINIKLLDLEDRKEDIPLLVKYFFEKLNSKNLGENKKLDEDVLDEFKNYRWTGNIRELRNFVEKVYYLCDENNITKRFVMELFCNKSKCDDKRKMLNKNDLNKEELIPIKELEKQSIQKALIYCEGNIENAAKVLGISRATMYRKINKYEIKIH